MQKIYLLLFGLFFSNLLFGQGKLLLVGGGAEGSWSDTPYSWGIEQAANHKVAIISFNSETEDLPEYFISLGASEATNFQINSSEYANSQALENELLEFDFFFFKGGDQSNYYETYKGTNLMDIITQKFNDGGVIGGTSAGMAILSQVVFTASNGSVYPDDGLVDITSPLFNLKKDFLNLQPDYIFDTHFIERGRIFRLMAFMAHWDFNNGASIGGIGVDDQTALCIDSNNVGQVYGTGAVTVITPSSFTREAHTFTSDSLNVFSLTDGQSFNLLNFEIISAPALNTEVTQIEENGNYTLLLSGNDEIGDNLNFLEAFVNEHESSEAIVIVSGVTSTANAIKSRLHNYGAPHVTVLPTLDTYNHVDSISIRNNIRQSRKVLFVGNNDDQLFSFLEGGPTGELLHSHLFRNEMIIGFMGQDSRFSGPVFVTNHLTDPAASYRNRLDFREGLGLLKTTAVMPNTIDRSTTEYYENTTSSIPFMMAQQSLKYGLYLMEGSYVKLGQLNGRNMLQTYGDLPTLLINNESSRHDFSTVRNVVAYDRFTYQVMVGTSTFDIGTPVPTDDPDYELEIPSTITKSGKHLQIEIINTGKGLFINNPNSKNLQVQLFDLTGRCVSMQQINGNLEITDQLLISGLKILVIKDQDQQYMFTQKLYFN